jgi:hypothetical protein
MAQLLRVNIVYVLAVIQSGSRGLGEERNLIEIGHAVHPWRIH